MSPAGGRPRATTTTVMTVLPALLLAAIAIAGCTSDATPAAEPADYRAELTTLCESSSAERAALAEPVDNTGVATFARTVADVLTREADAARALQAPTDLDSDHRAFVQNTADQAAGWSRLATVPAADAEQFGAVRTNILELTLGRDDLATAMGVPACRVTSE